MSESIGAQLNFVLDFCLSLVANTLNYALLPNLYINHRSFLIMVFDPD